jgi:hypothetical protein
MSVLLKQTMPSPGYTVSSFILLVLHSELGQPLVSPNLQNQQPTKRLAISNGQHLPMHISRNPGGYRRNERKSASEIRDDIGALVRKIHPSELDVRKLQV